MRANTGVAELQPSVPLPYLSPVFDRILSLIIRLASATVIVGWLLSAIGQLNGRGYLLLGLPFAVVITLITFREGGTPARGKTARRFRCWWKRGRLLPLIYFATAALIFGGSLAHEPNNFDGVSYREPKVLSWLDQGQWNWIDSPYEAVNYTLPNYEWLTVPLFLATHGFHFTVIINWLAMLLLPSLLFTLLRAFGASGRAAFDWMWIFPCGYMIALQAGGIGNDLAGMAAFLAALHCANRFARDGTGQQLFDALLAAGFCTGVKLSNLPLPAFVLILLLRQPIRLRGKAAAIVFGLICAAAVSALIPLVLNHRHAGNFFGTKQKWDQTGNPAAGLAGNSLIMLASAFQPPVLPGAGTIMPAVERCLGGKLDAWLHSHYEKFSLKLNELPQEESGGLGLGITAALGIQCWLAWRVKRNKRIPKLARWQSLAWIGFLGLAMVALAAKLGTGLAFPRNILPWYPAMLAPLVAWFNRAPLLLSRLWRIGSVLAMLCIWPGLVLNPARPLPSAGFILKAGAMLHVPGAVQERMRATYEVYASRADAFAELTAALPTGTRVLGLATDGSEPTASFWKPYGSHRCVYILSDPKMKGAPRQGVEYFVVAEHDALRFFNLGTDEFLARYGARAVKSVEIRMLAGRPAARYTLAKFEPPP